MFNNNFKIDALKGTENYKIQAIKMKDILAENGMLEYITTEKKVKEGEEKDESILKQREKNQKALVMIYINITDKVVIDIANAMTAYKA